jgi:hypothetical protein
MLSFILCHESMMALAEQYRAKAVGVLSSMNACWQAFLLTFFHTYISVFSSVLRNPSLLTAEDAQMNWGSLNAGSEQI